tara:strand:- start:471 stop:1295 length:825 start_codon:yes stop_codon:yes gene_type:complete
VKLKHNKKRNTAILYEVLIVELTKATVNKEKDKKDKLLAVIKESFHADTLLRKELELYKVLYEGEVLNPATAERLIYETRKVHSQLDKKRLFNEQTALINRMNRIVTKNAFSNFIPSYKNLATIFQIFNDGTPIKKRVLLEENLISTLSSEPEKVKEENLKPIDNLVYNNFVQKFNDQYSKELFMEQKELLTNYISSFTDNGLKLKIYLNEEVARLKVKIGESLKTEEFENDDSMIQKANEVLKIMEGFHNKTIDKTMIKKVLKIQNLVRELGA